MLVDSNILVYSLNLDSPKSQSARKFLLKYKNDFCVAQQNVMETLRIITHQKFPKPMQTAQATKAINNIIEAVYVITPSRETMELAIKLINKYKVAGRMIFDAYLVATMLTNGENVIATDNEQDLGIFPEIKVVNPFK